MMVNIYEAKSKLSSLLERARSGEEVVIAKAGRPVARLVPVAAAPTTRSGVKLGGLQASKLKLAADFHAAISDDDLLGS